MAAHRERVSNVDTAWLRMDDPTNLMMIVGVLTFSERLAYGRLREIVEERLLRFDRFRQRVVEPRTRLGSHYWETDFRFDLDFHLRRAALPEPQDQDTLQQLVSDLMSVPLDRNRPLWQFHLVEEYEGGSALIARLHHAIADGIALMRVLLSLTDDGPEPPPPTPGPAAAREKVRRGRLGQAVATARQAWQLTESAVGEGLNLLQNPERAIDLAKLGAGGSARLGQILMRWPDPKTLFKGPLGVSKRVAWSEPLALADVKAVGGVTGGTVNDVLLTAVSGSLRRYLREQGEPVEGLNFHAVVPVNLRPLDGPIELGNKFGLVFLPLPIGVDDIVERIAEVKVRMQALKESPEAAALFTLLNAVGMAPSEIEQLLLILFGMKATGVMTNVPGPKEPLYLAGSPLEQIMFWVPQSGRLGLGVSIMSYNGEVLLGVATDAGLVPDPETIVEGFHEEFAEMMKLVRMVEEVLPEAAEPEAAEPEAAEEVAGPREEVRRCQATTRAGDRCRNRARPGSSFCHVHQP